MLGAMPEIPNATSDDEDLTEGRLLLDKAVRKSILLGSTLEWRDNTAAVLRYDKKVSHIPHAVLSVLTGGIWAVVWLVIYLRRRVRFSLEVLPDGSVDKQYLP